jgi:hypothetical protein
VAQLKTQLTEWRDAVQGDEPANLVGDYYRLLRVLGVHRRVDTIFAIERDISGLMAEQRSAARRDKRRTAAAVPPRNRRQIYFSKVEISIGVRDRVRDFYRQNGGLFFPVFLRSYRHVRPSSV